MKISDALQGIGILGMDTAPFIYFVENHPAYYPVCQPVFASVTAGNLQVCTSVTTLAETLVVPLRQARTDLVDEYQDLLLNTIGITTVPISSATARQAADLRARYRLRLPDALVIASALQTGCNAFLTNDTDLRRVTEIRVLIVGELTP